MKILDIAVTLFAEKVYKEASVRDIPHIEPSDMEDQETLLAQLIDFLHFLEDNRPRSLSRQGAANCRSPCEPP